MSIHPARVIAGVLLITGSVFVGVMALAIVMAKLLVIAGMELWQRWRMRNHPELQAYYKVTARRRVIMAALYFGLAALLVLGMEATHLPRDVLR